MTCETLAFAPLTMAAAGACTVALAVAPCTETALAAALAREIGHPLTVTQQNVETEELAATSIIERWIGNDVDGMAQATLLGGASDGALAALPRLYDAMIGGKGFLPGKLDTEAAAFAAASAPLPPLLERPSPPDGSPVAKLLAALYKQRHGTLAAPSA